MEETKLRAAMRAVLEDAWGVKDGVDEQMKDRLQLSERSLFDLLIPLYFIPESPCPLVIRGGTFTTAGHRDWVRVLEEARARLERAIPCVGRFESVEEVDSVTPPVVKQKGSAWLVDHDIAVTNRHVVLSLLERVQRGEITLQINFCGEPGGGVDACPVREVLYLAPDCDLAFVRVKARPAFLPIGERITAANPLAVLGFPMKPDVGDLGERYEECFKDGFEANGNGYKRLSPGRLNGVTRSEFEHSCSTLFGSSGSVVLDLLTGEAIGLGMDGTRPFDNNSKIRLENRAIPGWVVRERLKHIAR